MYLFIIVRNSSDPISSAASLSTRISTWIDSSLQESDGTIEPASNLLKICHGIGKACISIEVDLSMVNDMS